MKKYSISLSDKNLQNALVAAMGEDVVTSCDDAFLIDDSTVNTFIANLFNRSNGILVIGSYGKTETISILKSIFSETLSVPYFFNLGKNKEIFLNGDGFFLLNPGKNLDLVKMLRPSVIVVTGIIEGKDSVVDQTSVYESVINKASVGVVINDDCPEASVYKDVNANTLVYSMRKKADILCKKYEVKSEGMEIFINQDNFMLKAFSKDAIAGAMAGIAVADLLGFEKKYVKNAIENYIPPIGCNSPIGTIAGVTIINDTSIYPNQIQKNIDFLSKLANNLIIIFNPDEDFYAESYEDAFSVIKNGKIGICGDVVHNKQYESLAKKLRKNGIDASFYVNGRETIKDLVSNSAYGDVVLLLGKKEKDFDAFCSNIWTTLESKVV